MGAFLKSIDQNPYVLELNYKKVSHHSSKTGGCISLAYFIIVLSFLAYSIYDLLFNQPFYLQTYIRKNQFDPILIDQDRVGLHIYLTQNQTNITFDNQYQYGLNVTYMEIQENRTLRTNQKYILNKCSNNSKYFKDNTDMFCLDGFEVEGRDDVMECEAMSYITLMIQKCDESQPECKPLNYNNIQANLYFINNDVGQVASKTQIRQKKKIIQITKKRLFRVLRQNLQKQVEELTLFLKKVNYQEEFTFFINWYLYEKSWFYDEEKEYIIYEKKNIQYNSLLEVHFKRSLYTTTYKRSFKSIITVFAQFFGFAGVVAFVCSLIYRGYNKWRFQVNLLNEKNRNIEDPNIFAYYKKWIKSMCKICRKKDGYKEMENRPSTQILEEEIKSQLDWNIINRILSQTIEMEKKEKTK